MKKSRLLGAVLFGAVTLPVDAAPIVLFEHSGEPSGGSYCSSCDGGEWRVWDRFSLTTDATISQISAVVDDTGGPLAGAHTIEFSIWDTTRTGQLFAQTFLWSELSPTVAHTPSVFRLFADVQVSLPAGNYFLSVYDSVGMNGIAWTTRRPTVDGFSFQSFNADGTGILGGGNNVDFVFAVLGTPVPIPPALWLFGSGLLGLIGIARKKAR